MMQAVGCGRRSHPVSLQRGPRANEIDISELEPGTYRLLIYTETSNATNYDEIPDAFRSVNESMSLNGKKYKIYYNKNRSNRIEIEVK